MRRNRRIRHDEGRAGLWLALLFTSTSLPAIANAADQAATASAAVAATAAPVTTSSGGDSAAQVGEVVVTAERRSESVEKVPASITALDRAALDARGISNVDALQFGVPSLTFDRDLGETQIFIRGVGRTVGDPGVAVNIDGVYQPRDTPMVADQPDLDRVEVLRGPQGTLYGRNANGGAINFITASPTDAFGGYVDASYAQYDERRLEAVLNAPVGERVRTRFVIDSDVRDQGFVRNLLGGPSVDKVNLLAGRVRVDVDLTRDLTLDLNINRFRGGPVGDYYVLTTPPNAAGISANPYLAGAIMPPKPWETTITGPEDSHRVFGSNTATLTWRLPFGELKSITAYQTAVNNWAYDESGADVLIAGVPKSTIDTTVREHANTLTQEVDLSGKTGPVDWVAGLYYMRDRLAQDSFFEFPLGFTPLPPGFFLHFSSPHDDTDAYAAFGDVTWRLTDRLRLLGGVRYSRDHLLAVHTNDVGLINPRLSLLDICPTERDDLSWDSVTYRAGAQYDVGSHAQVYGTVSDGFKSGGVNLASCNNTFNPETITSYEVGFKGQLLDGRLTLNAAAFWYDYANYQLSQVIGIAAAITNAGSATVKGLEFEAHWAPDEHWRIDASVSLLDARFGRLFNTDSLNPQLGLQDLKGHILPDAPQESGDIGISYRTDSTRMGRLTARVDVNARSKVYFAEFNTPEDAQQGYAVVAANLIWDSPDDTYSVRVFGNNLFNRPYWESMLAVGGLGGRAGTWGDPRQIGVELKAKF